MWEIQEYIYLPSWETKSQVGRVLDALAESGSLGGMDMSVAKPPSLEASV